jgi:hypothetical protein
MCSLYLECVYICRMCSLPVERVRYMCGMECILYLCSLYMCVFSIYVCALCVSCSRALTLTAFFRRCVSSPRRAGGRTHTHKHAHTHTHTHTQHTHTHTREARAMRSDLFRRDRFCVFWRLLVIVPYQTQCQYQ